MPPRALDLFAGCGGLSVGMERAGFSIPVACEIDRSAGRTYAANHAQTELLERDIRAVPKAYWEALRGEIDLVMGGPPCQGFSVSGRRQYGEVPSQNTLPEAFLDVVETVRPRAVLLENVAGFVTAQLKPGVKALPLVLQRLGELGYSTSHRVIQAADYGVPSLRSRLFVVATLERSGQELIPPATHTVGPDLMLAPHNTCMDAIGDLPPLAAGEGSEGPMSYSRVPDNSYQAKLREGSAGVYNHAAMRHTPRLVERFAGLRPGDSTHSAHGEEVTVYKSNNQRLRADKPSLCITANFQSTYVHPEQDRNLTAREAARLMSYPDSFVFHGKRTLMSTKFLIKYGREHEIGLSQYNQIGNSVPPELAYHLGLRLMDHLLSSTPVRQRRVA
jgi:DNA (cytosine-5)-methyltransferase 1